MTNDHGQIGSPSHAEAATTFRSQRVKDAMQWLAFSHLPERLRPFSQPFYVAAQALLAAVTTDGPELYAALDTLLSAKDHAVRAGIRHQAGRAGSVPRPQETVDVPKLTALPSRKADQGDAEKLVTDEVCDTCSRSRNVPHASWCLTGRHEADVAANLPSAP